VRRDCREGECGIRRVGESVGVGVGDVETGGVVMGRGRWVGDDEEDGEGWV